MPPSAEGAIQTIRIAGLENLLTALAVIFATSVIVFASFIYFAVRIQTKLLSEIRDALRDMHPQGPEK